VDKHGGMDPSIETIRWVKSKLIRYSKAMKKAAPTHLSNQLALTDAPY
jgi:hypothetical protein